MLLIRRSIPCCLCGCGKHVSKGRKGWNKFLKGHDSRNKNASLETSNCLCGCGNLTKPGNKYILGHNRPTSEQIQKHIERMTGHKFNVGIKRTVEEKLRLSNNWKASNNPRWNKGKMVVDGYVRLLMPEHPCAKKGYVKEERVIMETILGRYLKPEEVVHHINEIRNDNRPENLHLFPNRSEHMRYHTTKNWKENGGIKRA